MTLRRLLAVPAALAACLAVAGPAGATVFTVNQLGDADTGACDVADCSLRDAIDDANSTGGDDDIHFNIPGPGHHQISPGAALPSITEEVTIDGTTEPGWTVAQRQIEIDGAVAGVGANGLFVSNVSGVEIVGIAINNFDGAGILTAAGSTGATIVGNFIGTGTDGTSVASGNEGNGIHLDGTNHVVGGTTAADRNVIGGNGTASAGTHGINVSGNTNTIIGNYVGVDLTGLSAIPNLDNGVQLAGQGNTVGGTTAGAGNLISSNTDDGILIGGQQNDVVGNSILSNGSDGIELGNNAEFNDIGGTAAGQANTIASNTGAGVAVVGTADDNSIRRNQIFGNGGLGIDLGTAGVTPNDISDGDPGPNALQNFPVITAATATSFADTVSGTLNSQPAGTYTVEAFVSTSCDGSGNGEGATAFGSPVSVTTNASGNAAFQVSGTGLQPGSSVTVLATDPGGSTSEFSACAAVAEGDADLAVSLTADDQTPEPGEPFSYTATLTNRGPATAVSPRLQLALPASVRILSAPGCSTSGQLVTCAFANLASGSSVSRQVRVIPTRSGSLTATATGSSASADPGGAAASSSVSAVLPAPAARKQVNVKVVKGTVKIKQPGQGSFRILEGEDRIRMGSIIDTTSGRVRLTTSAGGKRTQAAEFFDGLFKVTQTRGKKPITELRLSGKLAGCNGKASAAAKKRKGRRLWGKGKGRFRTRGKHSSALVRGTTWLVEDRCNDTTLTVVRAGRVEVRDFRRKRSKIVRAGRSYVAR